MRKSQLPELKRLVGRAVCISLTRSRSVKGTLRGYDAYMNVVVESERGLVVIRGQAIEMLAPG